MRVHIECDKADQCFDAKVGNVYPKQGGRGRARGDMMILFHITEPEKYEGRKALMLIVNREGKLIGVDKYCLTYIEEKCPIAFVEGISDIDLTMRSL